MTVRCDWTDATVEARTKFPETVRFHEEHGLDLTTCDTWRCSCGNCVDTDGFDAVVCICGDDQDHECAVGRVKATYRCARCTRVYQGDGKECELSGPVTCLGCQKAFYAFEVWSDHLCAVDRRASAPVSPQGDPLKASADPMTALVVEVSLKVIVTIDAEAQPLTKAIVAEEAMSWLKTVEQVGELEGVVDSWTIIDRVKRRHSHG